MACTGSRRAARRAGSAAANKPTTKAPNARPTTKYMFNGKIIDKAKIAEFIPQTKKAENQGTEREILWRKLYLANVRKLSLDGEIYKIIAD